MTTPAPKLKPCPFCGYSRIEILCTGGESVALFCNAKNCRVNPSVSADTEAEATRAWNRRAEVKK